MGPRGSCFDLCHRVFCLFSSKSFILSGLTFTSLIHFYFIFVYGVRKRSNFILLFIAVLFSQHHLLKRLSLSHCIFFPPLSKQGTHHKCMGLLLSLVSLVMLYCAKLFQLYLTLCNPIYYSPSGSSVHGILQTRILEWVAMLSSRGSSQPRNQTCVSYISYIGRRVLYQ